MLKVLTSGATMAEALDNAQRHAVEALTVDGEVLPFRRVSVDLATSAPEYGDEVPTRFAGSVTFSVSFGEFGVTVDPQTGAATMDLPGIETKGLKVAGARIDAKGPKA